MIRTIQAEDVIQRYIAEFSMADFLNGVFENQSADLKC